MRAWLEPTLREWHITLSDAQFEQFERYADELLAWNAHTNLTAITAPSEIATRHFLDSLACARAWDVSPSSLFDIGTGAGFPGVPLKILWPQTRLLLADSVGKKTAFLQHLVTVLELTDVEIVTARAETLGRDPRYRQQFAGGVARAVASLQVLSELCLPLVAVGGCFVAPKGGDGAEEAVGARRAIGQLGGSIRSVLPVELPGVERRTLVVIRKTKLTPPHFPRAIGVPGKRPL